MATWNRSSSGIFDKPFFLSNGYIVIPTATNPSPHDTVTVYIKLSKDGGVTWQNINTIIVNGSIPSYSGFDYSFIVDNEDNIHFIYDVDGSDGVIQYCFFSINVSKDYYSFTSEHTISLDSIAHEIVAVNVFAATQDGNSKIRSGVVSLRYDAINLYYVYECFYISFDYSDTVSNLSITTMQTTTYSSLTTEKKTLADPAISYNGNDTLYLSWILQDEYTGTDYMYGREISLSSGAFSGIETWFTLNSTSFCFTYNSSEIAIVTSVGYNPSTLHLIKRNWASKSITDYPLLLDLPTGLYPGGLNIILDSSNSGWIIFNSQYGVNNLWLLKFSGGNIDFLERSPYTTEYFYWCYSQDKKRRPGTIAFTVQDSTDLGFYIRYTYQIVGTASVGKHTIAASKIDNKYGSIS